MREYRDAGSYPGADRLAVDQEFLRQRFGKLFGQHHTGRRVVCRR